MYETLNYSTELCHHGILGQRWGVRRFQNADGSLKTAGKSRYNKGSEDYQRVKQLKKKRIKDLTNEELSEIATRKKLEKEAKGKGETNKALVKYGTKVLTTAAVLTAVGLGTRYVYKHLPEIAGKAAKSATKTSIDVSKEIAKGVAHETYKEGSNAARSAAKKIYQAGHNTRKTIASSSGARAYVRTINRIIR